MGIYPSVAYGGGVSLQVLLIMGVSFQVLPMGGVFFQVLLIRGFPFRFCLSGGIFSGVAYRVLSFLVRLERTPAFCRVSTFSGFRFFRFRSSSLPALGLHARL